MQIQQTRPVIPDPVPIQPPKTFYRPDEVAAFFSVTRKSIYKWIEQGKLGAVKVGGVIRIPAAAVETIQKSWFE